MVGLFGPFDDFLQFGEQVAVEVGEEDSVDVQGVLAGEPRRGEQRKDVFEVPQGP